MNVQINDNIIELPDGATVADALSAIGHPGTGVATALNGVVVPAARRNETRLNDNDKLLVIKAFYGG